MHKKTKMATFLTTNGTSYHIEKIILEAKKELVLVSPYLQLSKTFFERLKDACSRKVSIKIIYGKDDLKPNERNSLAELNGLVLRFSQNLHAKCYFNEVEMVITSMNMYEFSEKHNREMGVLINKERDADLFKGAVEETISIINAAELVHLNKSSRSFSQKSSEPILQYQSKKNIKVPGYCIRCENRVDFNTEKPLCFDCYSTWAQFGNPLYQENVCHRCGEYSDVSVSKPTCYSCYSAMRF